MLNRRTFVSASLGLAAASTLPRSRRLWAANVNEEINVGFISCGSRSQALMEAFSSIDGVKIGALCDPDEALIQQVQAENYGDAKTYVDLRDLIADPEIDAVVIGTCNHWHCLAAIWAMEAGKHVYVEKPLSHTQWEGDQAVAAARRYDRICQVGTQQRSDPMQAEIKKFLHEEKTLGEIKSARVNRYGIRGPIGKRSTPLEIPKSVNYDLWLGPAQDQPLYRDRLHYDWHWDWNTGSGEMGNWGVHVLDDVRNNVFQDSVILPKRIMGIGGRLVWNDAGNTPNVHAAWFDTGSIPVVVGLSNLPSEPGGKRTPEHPGPNSGYIAYCEGGRLEGQRGKALARDNDGNVIRRFKGNASNTVHASNFIDAVRAGDASILNAEIAVGHASTGWCNMANVAVRSGSNELHKLVVPIDDEQLQVVLEQTENQLANYDIKLDNDAIMASPILTLDESGKFVGDHADMANKFLKREYREGYEVPEFAMATAE